MEVAALAVAGQEVQHPEHGGDHQREHPEGQARAAPAVGQAAAHRAHQRAQQRSDEGVGQRIHVRELALHQHREAGREADVGTEGADVQPAHQPVVLAAEDHRLLGERRARTGQVVHSEPGRNRTDRDRRHPDETGVLHEQRRPALHRGLRRTTQRTEHAHGDHQRNHRLRHRHTHIAQAGVQAQRQALLLLGVEERDVGPRRREVRSAKSAQDGDDHEHPVRRGRVLHRKAQPDRRRQQRGGGQRGPTAATEDRNHERIEDAQGRAGQAGQCHQPEQLVSAEIEADLRQADRHRREQHPDREGQQQRGNRDDQVAGGDPLAGALPVAGVFRRPVADDATRTGGAADNRIATDGHTWLQGCGMTWVLRFKL
ncbi:hypothetical protein G6F31_012773 [Rhizopus arrhizus]|nr:hypothetical protein G6F31_012773 [Rhizopus arrhizus]